MTAQEPKRIKNPYAVDAAAESPLFVGRETAVSWVQTQLAQPADAQKPLLIAGPARSGKTALLRHLTTLRFEPQHFTPLYIDVSTLPTNSPGSFLRALAFEIHQATNTEFTLRKTQFIAEPLHAFYQQGLQPALVAHERFLLLFDNVDALLAAANGHVSIDLLLALHELLQQAHQSTCLLALTLPDPAPAESEPPWLAQTAAFTLDYLTAAETAVLVQDPVPYPVVADVSDYIHTVTGGRPDAVQRLCHDLFTRWQQQHLQQITVADAAAVWRRRQLAEQWPAAAADAPAFGMNARARSAQTTQTVKRWRTIPRRVLQRVGGAALALVLILGIFGLTVQFVRAQMARADAAALAATQTATAAAFNQIAAERDTAVVASITAIPTRPIDTDNTATPAPSTTSTPTVTPSPTPTYTPTPSEYPPILTRSADGMSMIYIPAGSFLMGSAADDVIAAADEKPQRTVILDAFYIDQYEVNVEQYAAFLNSLGSYQRACENVDCTLPQNLAGYTSYLLEQDLGDGTVQYYPVTGFANYPANHISWYGAKAYCQSVGARLPTEAEWEYAARGADGRIYPWGNTAPDDTRAVFQSNDYSNMKPVDALPDGASPFGIYGMAGSLWEWTADWYNESYYQEAPNRNPTGPETGFMRVVRGGAWPYNNQADRLRSANRLSLSPEFISSTVGFRCARTP